MAISKSPAFGSGPKPRPKQFHRQLPPKSPWEGAKDFIKDESQKMLSSFGEQLTGSTPPAALEKTLGTQGQREPWKPVGQDPRFGRGRGYSTQDQEEIKRLRAELRRLKAVSLRHLNLYQNTQREEGERKRAEGEEEKLKKEKKKGSPELGALDWFKNAGRRAKGLILGITKRKGTELKPGAYRG